MKPTIHILILLSFFFSCKGPKEVVNAEDSDNIENPAPEQKQETIPYSDTDARNSQALKNEILFLGFNMHQDSSDMTQRILLSEVIIKEGKVKHSDLNQIKYVEGNLLCILYDVNDTALYQLIIENPLIQNLEYSKDDGNFARTVVHQNDAYFMIKVPNKRTYDHITFSLISDDNTMREIETVMLNLPFR